jgi:hypothetical protein
MASPCIRAAIRVGFILLLLRSQPARADVVPDFDYPPLESMQEALCAKEKAGEVCGAEPNGAPLLCVDVKCGDGRCLRCLRTAVPDRGAPLAEPTVVRLPDPAPTSVDDEPAVARATRLFRGSLAFLGLAACGITAALVMGRRRQRRVALAAAAVGLGLVLALVSRYSLETAVGDHQRRDEERKRAREVRLLPVVAADRGREGRAEAHEEERRTLELYWDIVKAKGRKIPEDDGRP